MTFKGMLGQIGIGTKQMTDRYQTYPSGPYTHDTYNVPLSYEPPTYQSAPAVSHGISSKHYSSHSHGHKNNAAMSALTLLAFLFFLNILQQCLKDHMSTMSTPSVVVMTAGREGEDPLAKTNDDQKLDKAGRAELKTRTSSQKKPAKETPKPNVPDHAYTKVNLAHYQHKLPQENNGFPGFVSAMTPD